MAEQKVYVLCFSFTPSGKVLLIRKNKPEWQKGKLNGVGGKVEIEESALQAVVREFIEETGIITTPTQWEYFATMRGRDWTVYCFSTGLGREVDSIVSPTDETLVPVDMNNLPNDVITNLKWLVPMAYHSECRATIQYL